MDIVVFYHWIALAISIIMPLLLFGVSIAILAQDSDIDEAYQVCYLLTIGQFLTGLIPVCGINLFPQRTTGIIWLIVYALLFLLVILLYLFYHNHHIHYVVNVVIGILFFAFYGSVVGLLNYSEDETGNLLSHWGILFPSSLLTFWVPLLIVVAIAAMISRQKTNNYINMLNEENKKKDKGRNVDISTPTLLKLYSEDIAKIISEYRQVTDLQIRKLTESIDELIKIRKVTTDENPKDNHLEEVITELHELKSELGTNRVSYNDNKRVISELYHFFETPFTNVIANCENLHNSLKKSESKATLKYIDSIENSIGLCRGYITFYREIENITSQEEAIDNLEDSVKASFNIYRDASHKKIRLSVSLSKSYQGFSNFELITMLTPLIQNAVTAAPKNTEIRVYEENDCIFVTNEYEGKLSLANLKKDGFSSRKNHEGLGLRIVRGLLAARKMESLAIEQKENRITFSISLKK